MGKTLKALAQLLGIQALHMTVYRPQTNQWSPQKNDAQAKAQVAPFLPVHCWQRTSGFPRVLSI